MQKILAGASMAFLFSIPFIARSQQTQTPVSPTPSAALSNLSKDQLISVINCLSAQQTRSLEACVNLVVPQNIKFTNPVKNATLIQGESHTVAWTGTDSTSQYDVYAMPASSSVAYKPVFLGRVVNKTSFSWTVGTSTVPTGPYYLEMFTIDKKSLAKGEIFNVVPFKVTTTKASISVANANYPFKSSVHLIYPYDGLTSVDLASVVVRPMTDATISSVKVSFRGTLPATAYLYMDQKLVASKAVTSQSEITFEKLSITIPKSVGSSTIMVKAAYPQNVANNSTVQASIMSVNHYTYGTSGAETTVPAYVTGLTQTLVKSMLEIRKGSMSPTISVSSTGTGTTTATSSTFTPTFYVNLKATGGNISRPVSGDVTVKVFNANGQEVQIPSFIVAKVETGSGRDIANGGTDTAKVTLMVPTSYLPSSGSYYASITAFKWKDASSQAVSTKTDGFMGLITPTIQINK